jgi:excisionase family DNA binding protein
MTELPDLLTIGQVAKYLQVSDSTVRRMLKDGRLRGTKLGVLWRIPRESVEELIRTGYTAQEGNPDG